MTTPSLIIHWLKIELKIVFYIFFITCISEWACNDLYLLYNHSTKWACSFQFFSAGTIGGLISVSTQVTHTVWCRYNTINLLQNPQKRHPISHPLGWAMGHLLWFQMLILLQSVQRCLQYYVILDHAIMAIHCVRKFIIQLVSTHWSMNKLVDMMQITFSNAISEAIMFLLYIPVSVNLIPDG